MTNHWIDIKNAKLIMVIGGNPAENHPVVWQYINEAKASGAKVIVADPRRTRMAAQADYYLRIRPGTNGALMMGLINYVIQNKKYDAVYQTTTVARTFADMNRTIPRWTDALFRLDSATSPKDYQRDGSGFPVVSSGKPLDDVTSDTDTVFQVLKKRAEHYTSSVVADICEIPGGAAAFEAFASIVAESHGDSTSGDGKGPDEGAYFPGTILYAMGGTQFTHASQDLRAYCILQLLLGNMGRAGGGVNALRGIHNVQGSTDQGVLFSSMPGYSDVPGRAETTLAADVTSGASSISVWAKSDFTVDDQLTLNPGASPSEDVKISSFGAQTVPPFTVNLTAPTVNGYASGKTVRDKTSVVHPDAYGRYMDKLFGGPRVKNSGFYWNNGASAAHGWNLQQHGFRNMMWHYFKKGATPFAADKDLNGDGSLITNDNFDLMPKGNGLNHLDMFRKANTAITTDLAAADRVKCLVVLGQNPAVTEPNLPMVKRGLHDLDTLVVIDMFETETAGCDRKETGDVPGEPAGVTYLLPSASFVEEEGSVTNSGRWIQWRYKAINPQGGSKSDTEILLRLAKALDEKSAFTHIFSGAGNSYAPLYGNQYDWTPDSDFNAVAGTVAEKIFEQMAAKEQDASPWCGLWIYRGGYRGWAHAYTESDTTLAAGAWANDTQISVTSQTGIQKGHTLWIGTGDTKEQVTVTGAPTGSGPYTVPITTGLGVTRGLKYDHASGPVALVKNRAKSRGFLDTSENGSVDCGIGLYPSWGWAWIKNRRVLYNNNTDDFGSGATNPVPGDVKDAMVAPDQVARYFVHYDPDVGTCPGTVPYATTYRGYSKLKDKNNGDGTVHTATEGARMPKHWEPHESSRDNAAVGNLKDKYGTTGDAPTIAAGNSTEYPLVLTTFRVTEHFQGGPTTRNVPWLCELVPEPIIEINSADAYALGIKTGEPVKIDTPRAQNVGTFKAVVGTGSQANQRVKKGVVAVPWHWGIVALRGALGLPKVAVSEGPSANENTIDALDPNMKMPEFKACLCRIHK